MISSHPRRIARLAAHRGQLRPVAADIGHLVRDDQMVLGVDGDLHVVADDARALAAGRHRPGVGVGQGDLLVGRCLDLLFHLLEGLHLPPQAFDLLLEAGCLGLGHVVVLPVGAVQRRQVARDAGLHLLDALGDLGHREVLVAVVDGLELAPVDRHDSPGEQVELATQHDELRAGRADRRPIVAAKVGDRLEVRHQAAGQPHQLDVALGLPFEPPARLDAIEIAVEIDLQQRRWMIGRPSRRFRHNARKAQRPQVEFVDEDIDHADWIIVRHIIVQALREQDACRRSSPSIKRFIPDSSIRNLTTRPTRFHTAWTLSRHSSGRIERRVST